MRMITALALVGVATTPLAASTIFFREGQDNGLGIYTGTVDTWLNEASPGTNYSTSETLFVDGYPDQAHTLIAFTGIISPDRVPSGATIVSARLHLVAYNPGVTRAPARMLQPWDAATLTFDNARLGTNTQPGIQVDGVEAVGPNIGLTDAQLPFDVTAIVQAWASGEPNYGIVLANRGANDNGLGLLSSEYARVADRPGLEITFVIPEPTAACVGVAAVCVGLRRRRS